MTTHTHTHTYTHTHTRYIGLANESSKVVGMPDDTPMKVWVLISLAMVMSAGGASF